MRVPSRWARTCRRIHLVDLVFSLPEIVRSAPAARENYAEGYELNALAKSRDELPTMTLLSKPEVSYMPGPVV